MIFNINKQKLTELLKDFYTLTKIHIAVFDDKFCEITSYPETRSEYCRLLRCDPELGEACANCDREACQKSRQERKLITYRCHAGLTETVTPIMHENAVMGYIMLGQLLQTEDRDKSWAELEPKLSKYSVDIDALKQVYFKKRNYSDEKTIAAAKIMEACSGYIYLSKIFVLKEDALAAKLEKYIAENLAQPLSTEAICRELCISKTRLYELSEHSYGIGIAQHIRNLRVEKAKQLLLDRDKKVGEIADACGFPDYNYFTKVFKRTVGVTPREFRKQ